MLPTRRLFLLLVICLTVLGLSRIVAQDATPTISSPTEIPIPTLPPTETPTDLPSETPLPTVTPTPLPSETPTLLPTPTESETPTLAVSDTPAETATETSTAEMSESPTVTATAEASESSEPSPTLTLTASPSETSVGSPSPSATASLTPTATGTATSGWKVLFTDNFDTGELMLWKLGLGWGLVPSENGQALQAQNTDAPLTFLYNTLGDASVQMRVLLTAGAVRLSTRQSDAGAYSLLLDVNGQVSLLRGSNVIGSAVITPAQSSAWRTIGLSVLANNLSVTIDGIQVVTAQDAVPLLPGTFSVAGINAGTLLIDDVNVSIPNKRMVLSPQGKTLPATPTPQFTATPSGPIPYNLHHQAGLLANPPVQQSASDVPTLRMLLSQDSANCSNSYAIYLTATSYVLTNAVAVDSSFPYGDNGLPVIKCNILIKSSSSTGRSTIQRNSTAAPFRIFGVAATGSLQLSGITITGGKATATGGSGILNVQGSVDISNSVISGNTLAIGSVGVQVLGAGVYSYLGSLNISYSTVSSNTNSSNVGDGGGIGVNGGSFTMSNSTVTNNVTSHNGGGMALLFMTNANVTHSNIQSNTITGTIHNGTGIYVQGNTGTSVTNSCILSNPSVSFYNYGANNATATDNWWGNGDGPNTPGADTTNGNTFVNASNPKPYLPYFCTTSASLTNYGVYVAVQPLDSGFPNTVLQSYAEGVILSALEITSGALATQYGYSFNPQYAYQPDPVKFKKIMLGNDTNQIGFVFMDLSSVSIPANVNAPSQTSWVPTPTPPGVSAPQVPLNYLNFGRVCPFYIDMALSSGGTGAGGRLPNNVAALLPAGTLSVIGAKASQAHQALIICNSASADPANSSQPFIDWTAVYNLGLDFMYENGGVQPTVTINGTQVPTYFGAFQNGVIRDSANALEMGVANDLSLCSNYGNIPAKLAEDAGVDINCTFQPSPSNYGDWRRGQRGWGSPAEPVAMPTSSGLITGDYIRKTCGWQENPIDAVVDVWLPTPNAIRKTGANDSAPSEYASTAGDMFLNWVYRYNLKAPQRGAAFANYNWDKYLQQCAISANATPDPSNPGDARFNYMQTAIPTRFVRP